MNLRAMLGDLPSVVQYVIVLGIVMLILYVCLTLTHILGKGKGDNVNYDNPEEYEKTVPDLFASTFLKRKTKEGKEESSAESDESKPQD